MPGDERGAGKGRKVVCPTMEKLFAAAVGVEEFTPEELAWFDENPERYHRHEELRAAIQGFVVKDNVPELEGFAERIEKANRKSEPPSR